LTVLELLDLAG